MNQFEKIKTFLQEILEPTDCYVVNEQNIPTNQFKFFIDADSSFDIKKAVSTTRQLRKKIEESEMFPEGDFTLEVSSPGIDEPLQLHRQYIKNIGRLVKIIFIDDNVKPIEGRLKNVTDVNIELEIQEKKKKIVLQEIIELKNIKQTIVQIEF